MKVCSLLILAPISVLAGVLVACGCEQKPEPVQRTKPNLLKSDHVAIPPGPATYVGRDTCGPCHVSVLKEYQGSQHDRALEIANEQTVLAPFSGETLQGKNISLSFQKKGDDHTIQVGGKDHPIKWTIGVEPLQQYLTETERGRVQAFAAAYDTRHKKKAEGNWYFLDEMDVPNNDVLHWKGDALNWNFMCADCHSTHLQKNYNFEENSYNTQFAELDVSCEACHGPASRHLALAERHKGGKGWEDDAPDYGFSRTLSNRGRSWKRDPGARIAKLHSTEPDYKNVELDACAPCHSRRSDLGASNEKDTTSYFDRYLLRRIDDSVYFADGQIKDEVYVYGSFLQSRMYQQGVTCSDCHNPHTAKLRAPKEQLCFTCHAPQSYDTPQHHFHKPAKDKQLTIPTCVDCHMPERTYMGIDGRRDHSFSIPRPVQSKNAGSPLACESCHQGKGQKWASRAITQAHEKERPHAFAPAFLAAQDHRPQASTLLERVVTNQETPAIIAASALTRWSELGHVSPQLVQALINAAHSPSPLIRIAAAEASEGLPPAQALKILRPLWRDTKRTVRIASAMAFVRTGRLPPRDEAKLIKVLREAKTAREFDSDSIEGVVALASIEQRLGRPTRALDLYKKATERFTYCESAYTNWADSLRGMGQEQSAGEVLNEGLKRFSDHAGLNHARGLWLIRKKRKSEALTFLKQAFEKSSPANRRRYGYVYAIALAEKDDKSEAAVVLKQLARDFPQAPEIKQALSAYSK